MEMRLYLMKTRSGLHCGIGQGLSDIDLPTAKDAVTSHPIIPGSSMKGVLRDSFDDGSRKFLAGFGQDSGGRAEFAAALSFTDSRLLCLPVRSYFGTFAYLASPYTIALAKEYLKQAGYDNLPPVPVFPGTETDSYHASVTTHSDLVSSGQYADRLLLEEIDLLIDNNFKEITDKWAILIGKIICPDDPEGQEMFARRFVVADDNILNFFSETGLPVAAHNRIGENGVVQYGALWYEEFVPAEAIFIGAVYAENGRGRENRSFAADDLLDFVCGKDIDIQVGGNATTGRGLVTMFFSSPQEFSSLQEGGERE